MPAVDVQAVAARATHMHEVGARSKPPRGAHALQYSASALGGPLPQPFVVDKGLLELGESTVEVFDLDAVPGAHACTTRTGMHDAQGA